jgi:hypothetical protein
MQRVIIVLNLKPNPMKVHNTPFDFEFEFNGEIIPVNASIHPPVRSEERGTVAYSSSHPTFLKIYKTNTLLKAYEAITGPDDRPLEEMDKLLFTYKLCLASYNKFRKLR